MTYGGAKTIFWVGTLSSAILFLALTWDTHRQIKVLTHADRLSDQVVAGKQVFQKYNCNDCHTILGFGGYYAPDLTKVYRRRGPRYIKRALTEPEVLFANSFRHMPQQHITPEEQQQLLAFFEWVGNIDNLDWPPQDSKTRGKSETRRLLGGTPLSSGAALFKASGCFECHQLGGVGGDTGPALDSVGARMSVEQLQAYITDPEAVNPDAEMPAQDDLDSVSVRVLAEFLAKQKGE